MVYRADRQLVMFTHIHWRGITLLRASKDQAWWWGAGVRGGGG